MRYNETLFVALASVALSMALGCSSDDSTDAGGGTGGSAGGAGGGAGGGASGAPSGGAGQGGSAGGINIDGGFEPVPVSSLPGLASITFYERTGGTEPVASEFTIDGPELTTRLRDPLTNANRDIEGTSEEFYDVYYSDADGEFDIAGSYLTISGVFAQALPSGGGLNLAEIGLDFTDSTEFGNFVASYAALGNNKDESRVDACIDGDLQTHTAMGNTVGTTERLRITLGFESTIGPPK